MPLPQSASPQQRSKLMTAGVHHGVAGSQQLARDPVAYLDSLPYLPAGDRVAVRRADSLASPEREHAAAALAANLERRALYLAMTDGVTAELLSRRVSCVIDQPAFASLDLAALCLR